MKGKQTALIKPYYSFENRYNMFTLESLNFTKERAVQNHEKNLDRNEETNTGACESNK